MARVVALPHMQTTAVEPGDWLVTIRERTMPVPDLLDGWDYSTPIRLECQLNVDLDGVRSECALEADTTIIATAIFWASSTNRRQVGAMRKVDRSGEFAMEFEVDPTVVGGKLTLYRQLLLEQGGSSGGPFTATRPGSILWNEDRGHRRTVLLEGDAARFPTEVLDFSAGPVAEPSAPWWLDRDFSDMDASPLASIRLYVNSSHPRIVSLLEDKEDEGTQLVRSVMAWDVGRAMIHGAIDTDEFVDGWGHFRPGTLGESLEQLVRRVWPTHDARALRGMRADDVGVFESRLQGRLDALGMHK